MVLKTKASTSFKKRAAANALSYSLRSSALPLGEAAVRSIDGEGLQQPHSVLFYSPSALSTALSRSAVHSLEAMTMTTVLSLKAITAFSTFSWACANSA